MNKTVYLAGPIEGLTYSDATAWRGYAKTELDKYGIVGLSPMRAKAFLRDGKNISDSYGQTKLAATEEQLALSNDKGITTRDRMDIMRSDLVLMNLLGARTVSIGTMIEAGWSDAYQIPIILVIESDRNVHEHGMLREISGFRVDNLESGLSLVKTILS